MEASSLEAGDQPAVLGRVSWPAIAAGAMVATAVYFVLTLFVAAPGAIGRLRDDPSATPEAARAVADRPEVRQAGGEVAEGARQATWWTLLGVIASMATVIVGSLVGSGELLQPVPILGVRRPARPVHA